jgi:homoserine dehydrogenase
MLSNMTNAALTFKQALEQATINGYAEADPTLDIGGFDTQHKIGILASLAFGQWVPQNKIYVEGIEKVTDFDIKCAGEMGYVIKSLGIARVENKKISVRVYPAFIPNTTMLGNVKSAFNAIEIDGIPIGSAILTGLGAGMGATSSAVVADIVDIARNIASGSVGRLTALTFMNKQLPFKSIDDIFTRYYLRFKVEDKPGVVAKIAKLLGDKNISLSSVIQHEPHSETKSVHVVFMTHLAREKDIKSAVKKIDNLKCVKSKTTIFRVEAD